MYVYQHHTMSNNPKLTKTQALEPIISKQIMELHHKKHHQTYINNLNAALQAQSAATQAQDITALIAVQQKIKFNGGGHINHTLFWANLAPPGAEATRVEAAAPALKQALESRWGTVEGFWEKFGAALLGVQGSGWGWLVVDRPGEGGKLEIVTTKDQDPVADGTPVFGVDMWEHAYYLQVCCSPRADGSG